MATEILSYFPGQQVTVFLETLDGYGQRVNDGYDGYTVPVINRVFTPSFVLATGYPQPMTKLDTGLYTFQFTLPTGASSLGSYLLEAIYTNTDGYTNFQTYQIIVTAPFGNYGITVVGG